MMPIEAEEKQKIVYLYFYTDSVAFPRRNDQAPNITWPFLLKDFLERHCGVKVYPYIRGLGGGRITDIEQIFNRDTGYFKTQGGSSFSFAVFNIGVVDAAPRPFTYHLKKLAKIPFIGKYISFLISAVFHKQRPVLQRIHSFRLTGPNEFQSSFDRMVKQLNKAGISAISIDTPLTHLSLENRSPGLRQSIDLYNALKHRNAAVVHISTDWVMDEHYLDDVHLSELGHTELAQRLYRHISGVINSG